MMDRYIYEDGLETERLFTRFLVPEDVKAWSDFFADPEALEFFPFVEPAPNEVRAKNWIEKQLTRYREHRYGLQALIDKKTGEMVGQCGLLAQDIDGKIEVEVGYSLLKKFWGKGYAREAAIRFKEYGFAPTRRNPLFPSSTSIMSAPKKWRRKTGCPAASRSCGGI
ncbi:MAG: GNAT family N-acetyltransferase [Saprospirales bacterium]|nr:GNAT family N-acetyltransferase [Saprospirales bacterium]